LNSSAKIFYQSQVFFKKFNFSLSAQNEIERLFNGSSNSQLCFKDGELAALPSDGSCPDAGFADGREFNQLRHAVMLQHSCRTGSDVTLSGILIAGNDIEVRVRVGTGCNNSS